MKGAILVQWLEDCQVRTMKRPVIMAGMDVHQQGWERSSPLLRPPCSQNPQQRLNPDNHDLQRLCTRENFINMANIQVFDHDLHGQSL